MKSSCLIEKSTSMDSEGVEWADLLPELLEKISDSLEKHTDFVGFRSVCQSWRSSTRPLPQKLFPYFPYKPNFFNPYREEEYEDDNTIYASAICIVRSRSDPSKAWLAAVQEVSPGKLILRNALTYQEIDDVSAFDGYDLLEHSSSFTTEIVTRFYTHNQICTCGGIRNAERIVFVRESSSMWSSQLVGLCMNFYNRLHSFWLEIGLDRGGRISVPESCDEAYYIGRSYSHFVNFEGLILAINRRGRIFVFDTTKFYLVEMWLDEEDSVVEMSSITENSVAESMRYGHDAFVFVVSDRNLFVVWVSREKDDCRIYKVSLVDKTSYNLKQIGDLGDKVLFIGCRNWSFSISGQDLPQPWKQGNCIVFCGLFSDTCQCDTPRQNEDEHWVFNLGTKQFTKISIFDDLFSPPMSPSFY